VKTWERVRLLEVNTRKQELLFVGVVDIDLITYPKDVALHALLENHLGSGSILGKQNLSTKVTV